VPNILSVHGGDLYDPSKRLSPHRIGLLRQPIRRLLLRADALVGQSRNTLQNVAEIYDVRRDSTLIPLGIDRPPQLQGRRADFGIPDGAFVLVTVGRVVARKAAPQLVHALQASGRENAHLLLVGDGPEAPAVRSLAAALGLADRVHLLGQVSDQAKYQALSIADLFVSTTQHEGFGLVFLEAMAYGLPIVCYDHGGQTDFLADGETGALVPLNDLERFTRELVRLHDDADQRARMSRHNRRLIEDYFIDKCALRYETLFEKVVAGFTTTRAGAH
jgi:glycosyltransferase involved in cell wall biosynthesis